MCRGKREAFRRRARKLGKDETHAASGFYTGFVEYPDVVVCTNFQAFVIEKGGEERRPGER